MIAEAVAGRLGLKVGKGIVIAVALATLLAIAGLAFWRGMAAIDSLVEEARVAAIAGRDAHWRSEIERSNAEVQKVRADQLQASIDIQMRAAGEIDRLQTALTDLEIRNAALPGGDRCGIDRDRIRLLNK